jgi:hypothetical protein
MASPKGPRDGMALKEGGTVAARKAHKVRKNVSPAH